MNQTGPITLALKVTIPATLCLEWEQDGERKSHPATAADLAELRYRHQDRMYDRTREIIAALGLDSEDGGGIGSSLRYFIEHVTHWDGVHDINPENFADLRARLTAPGPAGGDE